MMQLNKYDAYLSYTCIIFTVYFPLFQDKYKITGNVVHHDDYRGVGSLSG